MSKCGRISLTRKLTYVKPLSVCIRTGRSSVWMLTDGATRRLHENLFEENAYVACCMVNRITPVKLNQFPVANNSLTLSHPAFSVVRLAWGGAQRLGCKPIVMKFCLSHYSHKSMPDTKFECSNFSIFRDMTSQNFPLKRGTSHGIRIITAGKWV